MMQGWWKTIFIQDLVHKMVSACIVDPMVLYQITHFEGIKEHSPEDKYSLRLLRSYLKGGTKEHRGTLQNYLAQMEMVDNNCML